jgi:hypothetical protein
MAQLDVGVQVQSGIVGFVATLETPKGLVRLPSWT